MIARLASSMRDTRGVAAAEFALLLPLLTALLYGGMEMGNFMWSEHQLIKSVRNGARFAARQGSSNFVCGASDLGAADTAVRNMIRTGTADGSGSPVVRNWTTAGASITIKVECDTSSSYAYKGIYKDLSGTGTPALASAMRVSVSTSVAFPALFGFSYLNGATLVADAQSPVTGS